MASLSREALSVAQDDRRHLVANCVVLHDVVCETDYELWIADEGWGCRPLSARASGAEDRTVRWLTGFVGHLALREEGSASRRLHRRDGRPHRRPPLGPRRERTRQHLLGRGSDTADRLQGEGESSAGKSGYDCIVTPTH